jgi:hypothetical protein
MIGRHCRIQTLARSGSNRRIESVESQGAGTDAQDCRAEFMQEVAQLLVTMQLLFAHVIDMTRHATLGVINHVADCEYGTGGSRCSLGALTGVRQTEEGLSEIVVTHHPISPAACRHLSLSPLLFLIAIIVHVAFLAADVIAWCVCEDCI